MSLKAIQEFEYHAPKTVDEALKLLAEYGETAKIMAGGTDLIPKMKGGAAKPQHLISIKGIEELHFIEYDEEKGLRFGACVPLTQLERHPAVLENYPALAEGCHLIASTQIRNAGTAVGNICNAVPSADSAPSMLALEAELRICSARQERWVPIHEFFTGVCKTILAPDELVTEVRIPAKKANEESIYFGFTLRKALDLAMVGVAANLGMENGICTKARISLGAVAITPKRAFGAESLLEGKKITPELADEAGLYASQNDCSPITDMRASAEYRREIVHVLVRDAILITAGMKERGNALYE